MALFIERAQAVKPDFELSADNAAVIVESGMIASMAALASVAVARNDNESLLAAARLFGSVDTLLPARDMKLLPPDVRAYIINNAALRERLDPTSFRAAYAIGCALDMRQAAAIAMNKPFASSSALHL